MSKLKQFLLICMALVPSISFSNSLTIDIAVNSDQQQKYLQLVQQQNCQTVNHYSHPAAYRLSLELLIICKALTYSQLDFNFKFFDIPNYARALKEAERGNVVMSATTVWQDDMDTTSFHVTSAVFQPGQFIKGLFTTPEYKQQIELKLAGLPHAHSERVILHTLRNYHVLSSRQWWHDWAMLEKLELPAVNASQDNTLCLMLTAGRAQLFIGELVMVGPEQTSVPCESVNLAPIEGIKFVFPISRHFAVSKQHPYGQLVFNALQKGLAQLQQQGEIELMLFPTEKIRQDLKSRVDLYPH
ncbi:hypothetical protein [Catenovulum agarivorans]|uniref:hypothetical protein n=1 Tax=Catenovulum agarivorans TaxID=1172192 RepID=UPI0012FBB98F|nr:hypothetical protein [Catenovulum agarivorans]